MTVSTLLAEATRHQQHSGQRPLPTWYEVFHSRATLREALTNAAVAGGVPRAWVDHVRERGERAVTWNPDLYLRTPEPRDWEQILTGLDTDVQRLREWTALSTAYGKFGAATQSGIGSDLDRNVRALRARTAGVANLLGLTSDQGQQLWGSEQDWVDAGVSMLDSIPVEGSAQRWRQVARTDIDAYALQATALAEAGITIGTAAALVSAEALGPGIGAALTAPQPLFQSATPTGDEIETAIDAANPTFRADAEIALPTFSDAADTDPWSGDLAPTDIAAEPPVWQAAEL
ncbi:hypothetical protein OHB12_04800 [Nocardia sp. NBC_01730]|uniref:hypothetical protein n=1 Tax=Nocardia sp. NBC_01730 TaxID=2975998 RepID=UPI002E106676|nr:hypothetical protein OHB12_04800 [Nocardia sp. NBC_01730]